jgi:LacI family transcriptional regulator
MPALSQDGGYWRLPVRGIEKARRDLHVHKVEVEYYFYDKHSVVSFRDTAGRLLDAGLDGLLIAPSPSTASREWIQNHPPGVPFVFFDSEIPDCECLSAIGQDAFQSGLLSAKLMHTLVRGTGSIAVIRMLPEDYHIDSRAEGFRSYFRNKPEFRIVTSDADGGQSREAFHELAERLAAENPDLKGVFVTNALVHRMALPVRMLSHGTPVHLIGYDLIEENIHCLKEGLIDYLISQSPETQGYQGINTLYRKVVLLEPVDKRITMRLDIVTKENLAFFQAHDDDGSPSGGETTGVIHG